MGTLLNFTFNKTTTASFTYVYVSDGYKCYLKLYVRTKWMIPCINISSKSKADILRKGQIYTHWGNTYLNLTINTFDLV